MTESATARQIYEEIVAILGGNWLRLFNQVWGD